MSQNHGSSLERPVTPYELRREYPSSDDEYDSAGEATPLTINEQRNVEIAEDLPAPSTSSNYNRHDPWVKFRTRLRYYVPVFHWLPSYSLDTFWNDFFAGLTVSAILLPSGLSYSILAKVPPVHGLYTIVIPGVIYSFLGTSRQLSIGPEALVSMLTGSAVAQAGDGTVENAVVIASLVTFFTGLLTLILGLIRLGFIDSVLSRALLRGFITAVAIVIIIEQMIPMLGLTELSVHVGLSHASSTVTKAIFILKNLDQIHVVTTAVSFGSLAFLLVIRFIKTQFQKKPFVQFIPEFLIDVIIFTVLCGALRWDQEGVKILGTVQGSGFPKFSIPSYPNANTVKECFEAAVLISIIGFVESIVVTKTYATKHNYAVSPNRELVALGSANFIGSFFGCIPAYGGMARSGINDQAGARTQLAGLITAMFVLLCLFFFLPAFYYLPKAILASIVTIAALALLEETPHDMKFIYKIRAWSDMSLLLLTFFVTIFVSIEYGTLISVALSLLLVVKHSTYPRIFLLGRVQDNKFKPIRDFPDEAEHVEGVLVIRIAEPLYFANTGQLKDRLRRLEQFGDMSVHPSEDALMSPIEYVIFDIETMEDLDASAAQILLEIVDSYHARGVKVFFVKLRPNQKKMFTNAGLINKVGEDNFFSRITDVLGHIGRAEQLSFRQDVDDDQ
ncbi:6181_t:CDS:2 [Paraglomus brasilianum]|uniref:6181_t:CDS:1 n=1 Tax=Paraglomus brasilianum TaxID=144538 RepID=A0A9N9CSF6_9GLOM|nr:6181_t:CDS:2 [Paraglomus brasilianum]